MHTHDVRAAARALGGDVSGRDSIVCPGPGHSERDRSLSVRLIRGSEGGFSSIATPVTPSASAKITFANGWASRRGGLAIALAPTSGAIFPSHRQSSTPSI
jgi:hypothetical protein